MEGRAELGFGVVTGRTIDELVAEYDGGGYGPLKVATADAVVAFAEPFAERTRQLLDDVAELDRLMAAGAERARAEASAVTRRAYDAVGFVPLP